MQRSRIRNGFVRGVCRSLAAAGAKRWERRPTQRWKARSLNMATLSSPRKFAVDAFDHDRERKLTLTAAWPTEPMSGPRASSFPQGSTR